MTNNINAQKEAFILFKKILIVWMVHLLTIYPQAKSLIPGGESVGVYLQYDGVLVTGTYAFYNDATKINLNEDAFQSGDLIIECNQQKISTTNDLTYAIQKATSKNENINVIIQRNDETFEVPLRVFFDKNDETFKTGLYITDHITALGTITYYDPDDLSYGAFGHQADANGECLNIELCSLFECYVTHISKNTNQAVGKKIGTIDETKRIGNVRLNTQLGIFGTYDNIYKDDLSTLETTTPKIGEAIIYTTLDDNKTSSYSIYIDKINQTDYKNIELHITDEVLLSKTNGIIPGMSGSPIIQDGKLVGAVTHVLVNDPTRGYGIFIENMLEVSK